MFKNIAREITHNGDRYLLDMVTDSYIIYFNYDSQEVETDKEKGIIYGVDYVVTKYDPIDETFPVVATGKKALDIWQGEIDGILAGYVDVALLNNATRVFLNKILGEELY